MADIKETKTLSTDEGGEATEAETGKDGEEAAAEEEQTDEEKAE